MLDISAFQSALSKLQEIQTYAESPSVAADPKAKEFMQMAMVKGYEYSYEMATKTMKRTVDELELQRQQTTEWSFKEILRIAFEHGLISAIEPWVVFREKRNKTSHAYAEEIAEEVLSVIPSFLKEAFFLLNAVQTTLLKDTP